jgi:hypothetical protein
MAINPLVQSRSVFIPSVENYSELIELINQHLELAPGLLGDHLPQLKEHIQILQAKESNPEKQAALRAILAHLEQTAASSPEVDLEDQLKETRIQIDEVSQDPTLSPDEKNSSLLELNEKEQDLMIQLFQNLPLNPPSLSPQFATLLGKP